MNKRLRELAASKATLREVLPEFEGYHIRIGYTNGSGFVFCGHCVEGIVSEIEAEQEFIRSEANRIMKDTMGDYNFLDRIGLEGFCNREVEKSWKEFKARLVGRVFKPEYKMPDRAAMVSKYEKRMNVYKKAIEKYTWCLEHPNMILDATFVETYPSIDPEEPDTVIILVDGKLSGKYWNEKEYKNRYEGGEEDEQDTDE